MMRERAARADMDTVLAILEKVPDASAEAGEAIEETETPVAPAIR
jgi:hypothetical protein